MKLTLLLADLDGGGEYYVLWFSWIQSYSVAMKPNQLHMPSEYAPESTKYRVKSCVLDLPFRLVRSQSAVEFRKGTHASALRTPKT